MGKNLGKRAMQKFKQDSRTVCNRAAESACIVDDDFNLPADGWVPFLRLGEFPVRSANAPLRGVQVVDEKAAQSIVNNRGSEDLLLDFDHFSRNPEKASEAAGWIQDFQIRETEREDPESGALIKERHVFAKIRWSKAGRESVEGGNFRYISPDLSGWEFLGGGKMRPMKVVGGGLTNRPAITGQLPVSNRDTEEETSMDYKQLLIGLLSLPATASDDVISNRVTELTNDIVSNRDAVSRVKELEKTIATQNAQLVERDLVQFDAVISNREAVEQALLKDRSGTLELLKSIKAPAKPKPAEEDPSKKIIFNRDTATEPESKVSESAEAESEEVKRAAVISNRASEIMNNQPGTTLPQAYLKAKAEFESSK